MLILPGTAQICRIAPHSLSDVCLIPAPSSLSQHNF
nr:MAG TPA: hypothetical protein [Caudoviricetes sp.]